MVEWITVRRHGIEQLREFFSFTDGPLLCVRPEETHDIHAIQPNTPAILLTDDDQDSMFHRSLHYRNHHDHHSLRRATSPYKRLRVRQGQRHIADASSCQTDDRALRKQRIELAGEKTEGIVQAVSLPSGRRLDVLQPFEYAFTSDSTR